MTCSERALVVLLEVGRAEQGLLRWRFSLEHASLREPVTLSVLSSRDGRLIFDVQQVGAAWADVDLPRGALEVVAERIREEVARAKLSAVLAEHERRAA